ncbi:hypothetical protein [Alistipes sp.]|uniref:hypothetical protein n=1 Tax=Alistipes sp. TaxID=1872444 RepID=UPI003A89A294
MRVTYLILLGIASFLWQPCQSQVIINEELKNKLCSEAFGTELETTAIYPWGRERIELYPESLISIQSLFSCRSWSKKEDFETLPYDILRVSAGNFGDRTFLVIGTDIIPFDIFFDYPVVIKKLISILKEYQVDENTLIPLFCARLSIAWLRMCYNEESSSENEIIKTYQKYWQ